MEDGNNGPTFWVRIYVAKSREEVLPVGDNQRLAYDILDIPFRLRIPKMDEKGRYFVEFISSEIVPNQSRVPNQKCDLPPETVEKLGEALEMMPDSVEIMVERSTIATLERIQGGSGRLAESATWIQYGSASDKYACLIRFVNRRFAKFCVFLPNDTRFKSFINTHIVSCAVNKKNVDVPQTIFLKSERDLPTETLRLLDI